MFRLRPYQQDAIGRAVEAWAGGAIRILIEMATGTGKTVLFGHLARQTIEAGKRVLILAHRDELVRQAADKVGQITGIQPAIEKGEERADEESFGGKSPLVVSSIQTQYSGTPERRRMHRFDPAEFGLVVADECHHSTADSWVAVLNYYLGNPECRLLGVTATPDRNDDRNLGSLYQQIAYRYQLHDAIADGYLVPVRQRSVVVTGIDFSQVKTRRTADGGRDFVESELDAVMAAEGPVQQVASATIELTYGLPKGALKPLIELEDDEERRRRLCDALAGRAHRRTLVFCVSVNHARLMANILNRWLGVTGEFGGDGGLADSVDGQMDLEVRREKLRAFADGTRPFLCNCMIATEGFDEPRVGVVVVARPTKSRSLLAQMVGRGTRPLPAVAAVLGDLPDAESRRAAISGSDKPHVDVIDFTDNTRRHELVTAFELVAPDADAEVLELAQEIAEETGADVGAALASAEAAVESEREANRAVAEAEAERIAAHEELSLPAWRRALVGAATYEVDDEERTGGNVVGVQRGGATDKQIAFLEKLGVNRTTASGYSKRQASAVIEDLKAKRCTKGQAAMLRRLRFSEASIQSMNFETASEAINGAVAQGAA